MSQNSQDPFSMWMEMNKNMWNSWASQMGKTAAPASGEDESAMPNPMKDYYEFFTKGFAQNPMFSTMMGGNAGNMVEQMQKQWQDSMRNMSMYIPNQSFRDGYDRFINAYQMFNGLQSYWDNFLKNMPTDITDWNAFAKPLMDTYQNLSNSFIQPFMPDQIRNMFTMPFESLSSIQNTLMEFFKPLLDDSTEMQGLLFKALQGDKEAYLEFLKSWADVYKKTLAKLLNAPAVGSNRESIEKMMKLLDYYVNFVISYNEYSVMISNLMTETMEKLLKRLGELQVEGQQPQTFMEFYKLWSSFNEEAFQELFVTDAFAKVMNNTVSAGSKLKIMSDDFMQDMLSFLPLPNRRELDGVEQEVYELRKRIKALEKELKAMKDQGTQPAKSTTKKTSS